MTVAEEWDRQDARDAMYHGRSYPVTIHTEIGLRLCAYLGVNNADRMQTLCAVAYLESIWGEA